MSVVTVIETTWEIDQVAIKSVRVPVFVEEQHVPYEIDFDDFDATAVHWLAYDSNLTRLVPLECSSTAASVAWRYSNHHVTRASVG